MSQFYMHENAMDVCIEVVATQYKDDQKIKMKVFWWNLGYVGEPYRLFPTAEKLIVRTEDWPKWKNITDRIDIKREAPGLP